MTASKTKRTYREFDEPKPDTEVCPCGDPVGALEISQRLGVQDRSVHMIARRGQMPKPDYEQINGSRAWEWTTILWWAGETDRLRSKKLIKEYTTKFGVEPPDRTANRTPPGVVRHHDPTPDTPAVPSRP